MEKSSYDRLADAQVLGLGDAEQIAGLIRDAASEMADAGPRAQAAVRRVAILTVSRFMLDRMGKAGTDELELFRSMLTDIVRENRLNDREKTLLEEHRVLMFVELRMLADVLSLYVRTTNFAKLGGFFWSEKRENWKKTLLLLRHKKRALSTADVVNAGHFNSRQAALNAFRRMVELGLVMRDSIGHHALFSLTHAGRVVADKLIEVSSEDILDSSLGLLTVLLGKLAVEGALGNLEQVVEAVRGHIIGKPLEGEQEWPTEVVSLALRMLQALELVTCESIEEGPEKTYKITSKGTLLTESQDAHSVGQSGGYADGVTSVILLLAEWREAEQGLELSVRKIFNKPYCKTREHAEILFHSLTMLTSGSKPISGETTLPLPALSKWSAKTSSHEVTSVDPGRSARAKQVSDSIGRSWMA